MAQQPLVGQCLLTLEASRSHSRHGTIGRIPLDEWSAQRRDLYLAKHNSQETDIHGPGKIQTHNPNKRAAADPDFRAHRHSHRPAT